MEESGRIKILAVEDNEDYATLLLQVLGRIQIPACEQPKHVTSLKEALDVLQNEKMDVVLLDLNLPDSRGVETLRHVIEAAPDAATIVLSAMHDDEVALTAMKAGAQEYLKKSEINIRSLPRIIQYAIERKKVEWQIKSSLVELQRLDQAKSEFITTVSHELRTPMAIIRESVSQICDGLHGEVTESQKRFLNMTLSSVDRLVRIINDLLDMSCLDSGSLNVRLQPVELNAFIQELSLTHKETMKAKGIQLRVAIPEKPLVVYLDKDRICQVFHNLMSNAIKYTDKGYVEVSLLDFNDRVECRVSDSGCGISAEDIPRLFTKFGHFGRLTPAGQKGTGLGLAISKGIMDLHQGKLWAESIPLRGSVFCFSIPKRSALELFYESVKRQIIEASRIRYNVSLVTFSLDGDESFLTTSEGGDKISGILRWLTSHIHGSLRRKADYAIGDDRMVYLLLPATNMVNAIKVSERIKEDFYTFLEQNKIQEKIKLKSDYTTFPQDGMTADDLFRRINLSAPG